MEDESFWSTDRKYGNRMFPDLVLLGLRILRKRIAMITLTRLNGQAFVMNADKIRYLESTPDTVVCCDTGEKMMVRETIGEVMRRAIDYARLIRKPITD
jgi:flagellar protein FlbD